MKPFPRALALTRPFTRSAAAAVAALLLLALSGATALAQSDEGNAEFWLQERALQQRQRVEQQQRRAVLYQRPTHLIRREKPVRGFTLSEPAASPRTSAPASEKPVAAQPQPQTAPGAAPALSPNSNPVDAQTATPDQKNIQKPMTAPTRTFTVAVIGDSLGQFLEEGLADIYADRPEVVILKQARESTGLVRDDYFNWVQAASKLASGNQHVDLAIMMIGSNDRQPIEDAAAVYDPLTPQWKRIYAERVDAISKALRNKGIPFLWVGAPIMRSGPLSDAMLALNDIYKTNVEKEGGTYLDVWDLFSDDSGQYALYGPDVNGDTARLRSSDGVHFTQAGARKLAQFVEPHIDQLMDQSKPKPDQPIAGVAPLVAPAEPLLARVRVEGARPAEATRGGLGDLRNLVPAPAAPLPPVIPIRPPAGPVVALTAPVVAPDGKLVSHALVQSSSEGENVEQMLSEGAPIQPRPGRADNFQWPPD
jgi:uncharacterized protein